MKGLWVKDWLVLKKQRLAFGLIFLLALLCLLIFKRFGIELSMLLFALTVAFLTLSTVTFDQQNHGLAFLLTLPITKRQYVRQKFLFLLAMIASGTLLMAIISASVNALLHWQLPLQDLSFITVAIGSGTFMLLSITLQLQLQKGPEVAQVAMSLVGAIVAAGIGGIYLLIQRTHWGATVFANLLKSYQQHGALPFIGCLLVLSLVIGYLNYQRSHRHLLVR
jgi:hypothetical protein